MDIALAVLQYCPSGGGPNGRELSFDEIGGPSSSKLDVGLSKTLLPSISENDFSVSSFEVALLDCKVCATSCSPRLSTHASPEDLLLEMQPPEHFLPMPQGAQKTVKQLPKCRMTSFDQEPVEVAHRLFAQFIHGVKCRRAVPVSLTTGSLNIDGTSRKDLSTTGDLTETSLSGALFFVPLLPKDRYSVVTSHGRLRFYSLSQVLAMCRSSTNIIDAESRHLLLKLELWMRDRHKGHGQFLDNLFLRQPAASRLVLCVHNPAHLDETKSCCNRVFNSCSGGAVTQSSSSRVPVPLSSDTVLVSDLREEVRRANEALTRQMAMEKCDSFVMNPLFASGLPYRVAPGQQMTAYFASGRPDLRLVKASHSMCQSESSDSGSWMDDYPLHKYAYVGNVDALKALLNQGHDPNQLDRDAWAPIHYAAWYGQLGAMQTLLNFGNCSVNALNRNQSTPLHFAAWCGHQYVVELLLSHPDIYVDARDKDGKTALELCECVPKPEWQAVASLLRAAAANKSPKIQVDLMDGSNVMLNQLHGADTTAAQLHQQMCAELKLNEQCGAMFALWICSDSLQLQLKAEHKPQKHMQQWKSGVLTKLADCVNPEAEEPKLMFRRSAKLALAEERKVKLTDTALALLFHEAHHNYVHGLYPCADQDAVQLAATFLQIIHGDYDAKKDKQYLANERTLQLLLPEHKLRIKGVNWVQKIAGEHKHVSKDGARNITGLQFQFLSFCWNLRVYGSAFFNATLYMNKPTKGALQVHVGVNDFGLHVINSETKVMFHSYAYKSLEWKHPTDRPYLEVRSKSPVHMFTLKTRQASFIDFLMKVLSERP